MTGEGESPRRLLAYIAHMPAGSATQAAIGGVEGSEGWDTQSYLIAGLLDAVRENTYVTAQTQSKKKIKAPEPIPVPGREKKKQGSPNLFAHMAAMQYQAARKG